MLRILTIANIVPRKNIDVCVDAANLMHEHWPKDSFEWVIIGSSTDRDYEQSVIKDAPPEMKFFERMTSEDITQAYQLSDVFVLPSQDEGFGMVFAEALYHGLPVVAHCNGGVDSFIQNSQLFYCVGLDAWDLVYTIENIATYVLNNERYPIWKVQSKVYIESELDIRKIRAKIEAEIEQVLHPSNSEIIENLVGFCPKFDENTDNISSGDDPAKPS